MDELSDRHGETTGPLHARDAMTAGAVCVEPEKPIRDIAALLLEKHISAVPVVDAGGVPIGMVSEGDLIGRDESDRLARSDWWLALATGARPPEDLHSLTRDNGLTARDVMSAPLVTVTEDTGIAEIARLFAIYHIKRVPVLRDGRIAGIVSRADLLRVLAGGLPIGAASAPEKPKGFFSSLFGEYHLPVRETVAGIAAAMETAHPAPAPDETTLVAADFRHLADDFHQGESDHREDARRVAARNRRERAKQLIDAHVFDETWRDLLHRARVAAENGETELLLSRFPAQLCLDGGRAINVGETNWPATLRGTPAELFLRWERELKPRRFGLSARVVDFPEGKPGDIGLFLIWTG